MIRLIRHMYIYIYIRSNLWNLWKENSTENLVLCRSLPQVHENHENVQGFSKQCSLYHPLWHLRHLMSRLPRFEGQVPHKVVVNLILISHVLQDSVPNSREIWRKLCHLPKNHSASQASQDISSIDAMLRLSPTHILRFIPPNIEMFFLQDLRKQPTMQGKLAQRGAPAHQPGSQTFRKNMGAPEHKLFACFCNVHAFLEFVGKHSDESYIPCHFKWRQSDSTLVETRFSSRFYWSRFFDTEISLQSLQNDSDSVLICIDMYWYVLICIDMYWYVLIST